MTGVHCPDNPLLGEDSLSKRVLADDPFLNGRISYQVLLNNAFASFRGHFAIPDALWIDEHPWALAADSETCGFGSQDGNSQPFLMRSFKTSHVSSPWLSEQQSGPTQRKTCCCAVSMPILEKPASLGFILNFDTKRRLELLLY